MNIDHGPYRLIQLLSHRFNGINAVAYSPDGAWIAGAGADSLILIWDVESGVVLRTLEGHSDGVTSLTFSPDGRWIASGSVDRTVRLWESASGLPVRTLKGHSEGITSVVFGPDGHWLASGSNDRTVRLWDPESGDRLRTLKGHEDGVTCLACGPDGRTLVSGSKDKTVRLWSPDNGRALRTLSGHDSDVTSLAFSWDGSLLTSGSLDRTVRLWGGDGGSALRVLEAADPVKSLAIRADGRSLAIGSISGSVLLWRAKGSKTLPQSRNDEIETTKLASNVEDIQAISLAFSPDGTLLAGGFSSGPTRLWSVVGAPRERALNSNQEVSSMCLSGDGHRLACAADKLVRLWDATNGHGQLKLDGHQKVVTTLAFSPDGRLLASGDDQTLRLWDLKTQGILSVVRSGSRTVECLAFGPDGHWLASGSSDTVRLWNGHGGELTLSWRPTSIDGGVRSVAFNADGDLLAGALGDGNVCVWATNSTHRLWVTERRRAAGLCLAFSRDGYSLVIGCDDGSVRFLDAQTGRELQTLEGHTGRVTALAFSPDGNYLATGSADRTVRLWDTATGDLLEVHRPHPAKLECLGLAFVSAPVYTKPFAYGSIWLRTLDAATLEAGLRSPRLTVVISAKVVLLGESDVGKTTLALRLAEDRYEDQETTRGVRIWNLPLERLDPSHVSPPGERREVVLWDLGGQDEYRLIHQIFIHDTELALLLLHPTRGQETFDDTREWSARLDAQCRGRPITRLLVGSKLDAGPADVDRTEIERLQADCRAVAFLPTSAKKDLGIDELRLELARRIDWTALGRTRRPALFQQVRDEIERLRTQGEVTLSMADLGARMQEAEPDDYSDEGLDQVVDQLARQGLIADTRLPSGERVLVLQIGEIERYAGSLIYAAKENLRIRGVPVLDEREITDPGFAFPHIRRVQRLAPLRERVVLECVIGLLIEHGICLRQPGLLIFASMFPGGAPDDEAELPKGSAAVSLYYDFTGPIGNLYAKLVAQTAVSERFGRVRLAAGRAEFDHAEHGLCGVRLKDRRSGRGHLDIYFSESATLATRRLFRGFVEGFLRHDGVEVREAVGLRCVECGHRFAESDVRGRIAEDAESIFCPRGHGTRIGEAIMRTRESSPEVESDLVALRTDIERQLQRSAAEAKRALGRIRVYVSYARTDEGLCTQLVGPLNALANEGVLEVLYDREYDLELDHPDSIDARLDEAQIVLLLVSADFLASRYCGILTARALRREAKGEATVIPVLLRPTDWQGAGFGRLPPLPRDARPVTEWPSLDAAFDVIITDLRQVIDSLLRTPDAPDGVVMGATIGTGQFATIGAPTPSLRLLHLSDLHFGPETDPVAMFQPLERDIRDADGDLGFSKLDYLVISGDLTQRASREEFERASRFLRLLIDTFDLSPLRCLIVPGNHDLSWDVDVYKWRPARQVNEHELREGHWRPEGSGYLVRIPEHYDSRFENFARFHHELTQSEYPLNPYDQGLAVFAERDRIQLIGLNSAWEIDEHFRERASIHDGALARALSDADKKVASAVADGRLAADHDLLRIGVWHHPPAGNDKILADGYVDRLRQARVTLCLHGHVHEDRAELLQYTHPRKLYVAGAGSFGAVAAGRPESTPRLYNLVEVPPDRSLIRVHTRCMLKSGGAWEGWARWEGGAKGERRTFYEIPLGAEKRG